MTKYWQTEAFRDLQKAWYAKLSDSGFDDQERLVNGEPQLSQSASHVFEGPGWDMFEYEQRAHYYRMLGQKAHGHTFKRKSDEVIMLLFADGKKVRQIIEALIAIGEGRCRQAIRNTIRKYEKAWGLKHYSWKELGRSDKK
jgi:hypothetical protein